MLSCNFLNEGCEGGWAFFNGLFMEKGHMVREDCGPYRGTTNGEKCSFYQKCPAVAKIEQSYFVGDTSNEEMAID